VINTSSKLPAVAVFTLVACQPKAPALPSPSPDASCYHATYAAESMAIFYPIDFALEPGSDSGTALWLPAQADTLKIWRMFVSGKWRRLTVDSIEMTFGMFTTVRVRARREADSLAGVATVYSDVVIAGTSPPQSPFTAGHVTCPVRPAERGLPN
jgi:hypothetical protein